VEQMIEKNEFKASFPVQLEQFLADHLVECIWLLDFNSGRFKYISPSIFQLRGVTVEEALQERLEDIMTSESMADIHRIAEASLPAYLAGDRRAETMWQIGEFRQYHKDGSVIDVEISTRIVDSDEPGAIHVIGVTRDISRRKALERDLQVEMQRKSELIEKLKASEYQLLQLTRELREKNEVLEKVSITDQLTGIYNRLYFEQRATEEIERSQRYNVPVSLIIFDLDYFKKINDQWGHGTGDEVLKRITSEIGKNIRKIDLLARWGGEEFVILLPETHQDQARVVAEKLRILAGEIVYPTIGQVTASFGVAQRKRGEGLESWFIRVDRAMYRAKSLGRNLVSVWMDQEYLISSNHLEWRPEWESGETTIDEQHRHLLKLANRLLALTEQEVSRSILVEAFEQFLVHVREHFADEESMLRSSGYPNVEYHEKFHSHLVFRAMQLGQKLEAGHFLKSDMVLFLMDEIVVGHLLTEDAKFFPYFREMRHP
jgi:diguanylate cyclase (GGDEF)-like protein/hemerythrin-like metal-binding protein/PAS domain S-box-containing protein